MTSVGGDGASAGLLVEADGVGEVAVTVGLADRLGEAETLTLGETDTLGATLALGEVDVEADGAAETEADAVPLEHAATHTVLALAEPLDGDETAELELGDGTAELELGDGTAELLDGADVGEADDGQTSDAAT